MPLQDQHLHSCYSFDSKTDPRANVLSAIDRGLAGLIFTEHFDTHPDDREGCIYDDETYSAAIASLRDEFDASLFIGKGIEVCFQPEQEDFIVDFLSRHRFDQVILSVHYFPQGPVHVRDCWSGLDPREGTRAYFDNVLAGVRWAEKLNRRRGRTFDVLGHLDFVKRYTNRFFGVVHVEECAEQIDRILEACLQADLIPEINTSTLRQGLGEPMPGPRFVRRYAELGGRMMSVGSDAHRAEDIGSSFDVAAAMLRDAQLSAALFRQRQPTAACVD
jgi:histidinol-phosphatase (PHP family)